MNKRIVLYITLLVFSLKAFSQEKITTFGIQFKPIIPIQFLGAGEQSKTENTITYTHSPKTGVSFGMVIRRGFTKSLSLESGINFVNRNYNLTIDDLDSAFTGSSSFTISSYEIPILGLVYVQLSREMFMNVAGGISVDIYPTPLYTFDDYFTNAVNRSNWIQPSLLANVGWEYRTEKSGYWYFGASFHRPFSKIMEEFVVYRGENQNRVVETTFDVTGNYLTLDLRYFFHEEKEKKKEKKVVRKKFIDPRK
jgi:hypothetical protein